MESVKLICDREIPVQQQKFVFLEALFRRSLNSVKARAEDSIQKQAELEKLKANLRQEEDELVRVLAAKTRREVKLMALRDSISDAKARIEELKKTTSAQRARRNEYSSILSREAVVLATSDEKEKVYKEHAKEIQEAISWYNRVLGFQVKGGHGVKFTFHNISKCNPDENFSFTVRHANDKYGLLDCEPQVNGTKELISELNRTNDLFKFVRIMRKKFKEAAIQGSMPLSISLLQDSISLAVSAPVSSVSSERSESPLSESNQFQQGELNQQILDVRNIDGSLESTKENNATGVSRHPVKVNRRSGTKSLSPSSASVLRRSPRFKVKRRS